MVQRLSRGDCARWPPRDPCSPLNPARTVITFNSNPVQATCARVEPLMMLLQQSLWLFGAVVKMTLYQLSECETAGLRSSNVFKKNLPWSLWIWTIHPSSLTISTWRIRPYWTRLLNGIKVQLVSIFINEDEKWWWRIIQLCLIEQGGLWSSGGRTPRVHNPCLCLCARDWPASRQWFGLPEAPGTVPTYGGAGSGKGVGAVREADSIWLDSRSNRDCTLSQPGWWKQRRYKRSRPVFESSLSVQLVPEKGSRS